MASTHTILASHNRPPCGSREEGADTNRSLRNSIVGLTGKRLRSARHRRPEPIRCMTFKRLASVISKGSCQIHISDGRSQLSNYVDLPFQELSPQPFSQVQI